MFFRVSGLLLQFIAITQIMEFFAVSAELVSSNTKCLEENLLVIFDFVAATSNPNLHKEGNGTQMTEAEKLQAAHDHKVSTAFDFMALCSAPTWLEGKKRRSRRRKNPIHSPLPTAMSEVV
jgi:hypothetical protein